MSRLGGTNPAHGVRSRSPPTRSGSVYCRCARSARWCLASRQCCASGAWLRLNRTAIAWKLSNNSRSQATGWPAAELARISFSERVRKIAWDSSMESMMVGEERRNSIGCGNSKRRSPPRRAEAQTLTRRGGDRRSDGNIRPRLSKLLPFIFPGNFYVVSQ